MVDIYVGGMIEKKKRGNLALIIEESSNGLHPFLVSLSDKDYVHLTGVRMVNGNTRRIYQGINQEAGEYAAEIANETKDTDPLPSCPFAPNI